MPLPLKEERAILSNIIPCAVRRRTSGRNIMTTIFWAGDSTCQQNYASTYPQTGIAQTFDRYTRRGEVAISNHAVNGRSTRSFLDEGRLVPIYDAMQPGDFLFI